MELIARSGYRAFPARLPEQPIFYPVTSERYAREIAERWNAQLNDDKVGYATRFRIDAAFIAGYEKQRVGASWHEEYWIPAAELDAFNNHIVGEIEVIARYDGTLSDTPGLDEKSHA
ncbi:MAG: hypothetical protein AAF368_17540 [Planctomycetota bacterium]